MTQKDRSEIREMIHGILAGWQATITSQNDITNNSLKNIEDHLLRINGKVAEHEKIININLPHNIALCPQSLAIEDLKLWKKEQEGIEVGVIKREGAKTRNWTRAIGTIGVIIAFLTMVLGYIKLETQNTAIETKLENLGVPVNTRNGEIVNMPPDIEIKFFPNDFDSIK